MAVIQDLTPEQQDIVHAAMGNLAEHMLRATAALAAAGVPTFDAQDTIENAVSYLAEKGAAHTLEQLSHV